MPNEAGRVVGADGAPVPGAYVTGWIKRGPSGVIGTNKGDAAETVAAVLADLPALPAPARPEPARAARDAGPLRGPPGRLGGLVAAGRRGAAPRRTLRGAERVKLAELAEMLAAAHGVGAR